MIFTLARLARKLPLKVASVCMDAGFAINLSVQNVIKNMRMVKDGVPLVF